MVIEWAANKTAKVIKKSNYENTASEDVLIYGLKIIYNSTFIIMISLIIGGLSAKLFQTSVSLLAFALLRFVSGGYHLKSSDYCVVVSVLLITAISQVSYIDDWQIYIQCF